MKKKLPSKIEFDVIENGLDFIFHATELLSDISDPRQLKYAVLSLFAGVVLILKFPLKNLHWSLVFSDVDNAALEKYRNYDFKSVNFDQCIRRLKNIGCIEFKSDDIQAINLLRDKRNKLEHFGLNDSKEAILASSATVLDFIFDFVKDYINDDLISDQSRTLIDQIRTKSSLIEDFVTQRWEKIDLSGLRIITCPTCGEKALEIDDGGYCHFCGFNSEGENLAEKYAVDILGYKLCDYRGAFSIPVYPCPSCERMGFVEVDYSSIGEGYICTCCGEFWTFDMIDFCTRCGNPFSRDGSVICLNCFDDSAGND